MSIGVRWGWLYVTILTCLVVWAAAHPAQPHTQRVSCDGEHYGTAWQAGRKCTATYTDDVLTGVSWEDR